ncbi:MAG: S1C family serine protease, partial [Acidimicrobiales bacterium]
VDTAAAAAITRVDGAATPTVGQVVVVLGALPEGGTRVTVGTISATGQAFRGPGGTLITGGIEHTAPAAPGSSGGPVLDSQGRLLAVNTHRLGDGFYLAVPATAELYERLGALARGDAPSRPRLGVAVTPPGAARKLREAVGLPPRDGLLLAGVDEDGPAGRAGLRRGDLIVAVDGRAVAGVDDLAGALDAAGDEVSLRVVRHLEELDVTVRLSGDA